MIHKCIDNNVLNLSEIDRVHGIALYADSTTMYSSETDVSREITRSDNELAQARKNPTQRAAKLSAFSGGA